MSNIVRGKDVLDILTHVRAPATMTEIVRLFAIKYPNMPLPELSKSVKRAVNAGVRYGFLQNDDVFYYTTTEAEQMFLEDAEHHEKLIQRFGSALSEPSVSTSTSNGSNKKSSYQDIGSRFSKALKFFTKRNKKDNKKNKVVVPTRSSKKKKRVTLSSDYDIDMEVDSTDFEELSSSTQRRRKPRTRQRSRGRSRKRNNSRKRSKSRKSARSPRKRKQRQLDSD